MYKDNYTIVYDNYSYLSCICFNHYYPFFYPYPLLFRQNVREKFVIFAFNFVLISFSLIFVSLNCLCYILSFVRFLSKKIYETTTNSFGLYKKKDLMTILFSFNNYSNKIHLFKNINSLSRVI